MIDQACLAELRNVYGRRRKAEVNQNPLPSLLTLFLLQRRSSVSVWPAASLVAAAHQSEAPAGEQDYARVFTVAPLVAFVKMPTRVRTDGCVYEEVMRQIRWAGLAGRKELVHTIGRD